MKRLRTIVLFTLLKGSESLSTHPPQKVPIVGNSYTYLSLLEEYTVESAKMRKEEQRWRDTRTEPHEAMSTHQHNRHTIIHDDTIAGIATEKEEGNVDRESLLQKIKGAGVAGVISYGLVQTVFWGLSICIVLCGYATVEGKFPDFSSEEELAKLGAESFAYVNIVRSTIPLRIGLALSATPWVQTNVVDRFTSRDK